MLHVLRQRMRVLRSLKLFLIPNYKSYFNCMNVIKLNNIDDSIFIIKINMCSVPGSALDSVHAFIGLYTRQTKICFKTNIWLHFFYP